MNALKAPYPWFGGKSRVAGEIWNRFGAVRNYVEPFAGSLAVLLGRPAPFAGPETANDLNGWLCNFWRALQADPEAVAKHADWPVSELDLHARGDWLFYRPGAVEWVERIREDASFFDAKSAGWWVWGQCAWIGTGWGPRVNRKGVKRQRPHLSGAGMGVNRKRPHLGRGMGVNRQLPHLGDAGMGETTSRGSAMRAYLFDLAERLRGVRICCGDWTRVCGPSPTTKQGLTAILFDPPYGVADRADCYDAEEDRTVSGAVRAYCLERGGDPKLRIALCGYEGEHELPGWTKFVWKAAGGYGTQAKRGNANPKRERIWFSPHCLDVSKGLWP